MSDISIEKLVADYIKENGVTSTRDIAEAISSELGNTPSTRTVAKVLRGLGYAPRETKKSWWSKANKEDWQVND